MTWESLHIMYKQIIELNVSVVIDSPDDKNNFDVLFVKYNWLFKFREFI